MKTKLFGALLIAASLVTMPVQAIDTEGHAVETRDGGERERQLYKVAVISIIVAFTLYQVNKNSAVTVSAAPTDGDGVAPTVGYQFRF